MDSSNIREEFDRLVDAKKLPPSEPAPAPIPVPEPTPKKDAAPAQPLEASITTDQEVSRMSGPLDASIGDVADIPMPTVAPAATPASAIPVEMDASIGDVADVPAIVSPTHKPQPNSADAPVELVASIGDVDDLPATAYAPPHLKPHPPKPHTRPIGPEKPHPKPTPTRPVGPEKPHQPHIHPVGPEVPHSGEGGSIEPVGPERPSRPHIHPVGPEQPHEPESEQPIIDETPELAFGGGVSVGAGGFFRSSPFSSLFSSLFGDMSSDLNDPPSLRFRFSPEDETETTTTQLPGGGVLVVRRFHHAEPAMDTDPAALDALGPRSMMFPPSPLEDFNAPEPPPPFGPFGFFRRFFGPPPPPFMQEDESRLPQLRQQEHIRMRFPEDNEGVPEPMPMPLDASISSEPTSAEEAAPHRGGCRHKRHGGLRGFFKRVKSFFGGRKHHDDEELSPEVEADPAVIEARAALRDFRSQARKARKQYKQQLKRSFTGSRKERKALMRQFRAAQKAEKRQLQSKLREAIDAALSASSASSAPADSSDASDSGFITPEMSDESSSAEPSEEMHAAIVEAEDINAPSAADAAVSSGARPRFSADAGIYDRDLSTEAGEPTDEFMPPPQEEPRHHRGFFRKHKTAVIVAAALLLLSLALAAALVVRSRRAAAKTAQQPSVQMAVPPHTPVAVAYAILPAGDDAVRLEMQQEPQQPMVAAQ